MSSPSHSLLPLNFFIVLFTFPHHSSSLLIIPCNVRLMLCFSRWNVLCLQHYLALHTLPSVIAVKQLHVKKFHSHQLIIDYDNQSKHDKLCLSVYLFRGPLFLPLSARGFLVLAFTMTVAPLVEVTPVLTKVLASGCHDSACVCFRLAGTVDEGDTFSGNAFLDEDGAFSLSGSRFLSVETLVSSLEMDA